MKISRARTVVLLVITFSLVTESCRLFSSISQEKETSKLELLLAYMPREWGDIHEPIYFGPTITFFDFEKMRSDVGISPRLNGSSPRKDKLAIITKINLQGLELLPPGFDIYSSSTYDEWGWDIADFQQSLYVSNLETAIVLGAFEGPEIKNRLAEKGYSSDQITDFSLYEDGEYVFAIKENLLMIGTASKSDKIKELLIKYNNQPGLNEHASVKALLPRLAESRGAILSPSTDIAAWWARLKIDSQNYPQELKDLMQLDREIQPYKWDFMAIAYRPAPENNARLQDIKVIYHYPTPDSIGEDIEVIKDNLAKTPSFIHSQLTWKDFFTLKSTNIQDTLLIIEGQTNHMDLVGDLIIRRESFALLPVK